MSAVRFPLGLLAFVVCLPSTHAQWVTQTIQLQVGWNAVFLEVDPYPGRCELVLEGQPIRSVWTWNPSLSTVQFIQDPNELVPETPDFRVFYPPSAPTAFLTNLFTLNAGMPYLIDASAETVLNLVGRPLVTTQTWIPNSYNLVGFHVDPNAPPTFGDWFAGSPAHTPVDVWRLGMSGQWEPIPNASSTPIQQGEAYWVYSNGASTFQGPVELLLSANTFLDYPKILTTRSLEVLDRRLGDRTVLITPVESSPAPSPVPEDPLDDLFSVAGPVPLSRLVFGEGPNGYENYEPLPAEVSFAAGNFAPIELDLLIERALMTPTTPGSVHQSLLLVTNGAGFRRYIGVVAEGSDSPGKYARNKGPVAVPQAGLWVGSVELNKVSEPNINPPVLTDAPAPFNFRFMCHVDGSGAVRMLNAVNLYWRDGQTSTDPVTGQSTVVTPGRYVLVTPNAPQDLLNEIGTTIQAGGLRDGRPFSSRATALMFPLNDANGNPETPEMNLTGVFGQDGSTLTITMVEENTDPVNPFHHQFHPEHRYPEPGETVYPSSDFTITREITLTFTAADPMGAAVPGAGDSEVVGVYQEVLTGLRRVGGTSPPIVTEGVFRLSRASTVPVLNDGM